MRETMIEIIIIMILTLIAGVSLGTAGITFKSTRELLKERDERLKLLEKKIDEIEDMLKKHSERLSTLEDFALSSLKGSDVSQERKQEEKTQEEDDEEIDLRIWVLYNNGYSIRQIADDLGISKSTVHRRLQKILQRKAEKKTT